jgi:hypothetical protein
MEAHPVGCANDGIVATAATRKPNTTAPIRWDLRFHCGQHLKEGLEGDITRA